MCAACRGHTGDQPFNPPRAPALRQHHSPGLCRLSSSLHGWPTLLQLTGGCKRWAGHREDELLAAICMRRSGSSGGGLFHSPKREARRVSEWRSMLSPAPGFPARGPASGRQLKRRINPTLQISLPQGCTCCCLLLELLQLLRLLVGGAAQGAHSLLGPRRALRVAWDRGLRG